MEDKLKDFTTALERLEEVLKLPKTDISRDSALLRFQLCFDLFWKTIKAYLQRQGVECFSPRSCIQSAFQEGIISHDDQWLAMIDDRNNMVHVYEETLAEAVYGRLPGYLTLLKQLVASFPSVE